MTFITGPSLTNILNYTGPASDKKPLANNGDSTEGWRPASEFNFAVQVGELGPSKTEKHRKTEVGKAERGSRPQPCPHRGHLPRSAFPSAG